MGVTITIYYGIIAGSYHIAVSHCGLPSYIIAVSEKEAAELAVYLGLIIKKY